MAETQPLLGRTIEESQQIRRERCQAARDTIRSMPASDQRSIADGILVDLAFSYREAGNTDAAAHLAEALDMLELIGRAGAHPHYPPDEIQRVLRRAGLRQMTQEAEEQGLYDDFYDRAQGPVAPAA